MLKAFNIYKSALPLAARMVSGSSSKLAAGHQATIKSNIYTSAVRLGGGDHEFIVFNSTYFI